jgi:hypothetical protein
VRVEQQLEAQVVQRWHWSHHPRLLLRHRWCRRLPQGLRGAGTGPDGPCSSGSTSPSTCNMQHPTMTHPGFKSETNTRKTRQAAIRHSPMQRAKHISTANWDYQGAKRGQTHMQRGFAGAAGAAAKALTIGASLRDGGAAGAADKEGGGAKRGRESAGT